MRGCLQGCLPSLDNPYLGTFGHINCTFHDSLMQLHCIHYTQICTIHTDYCLYANYHFHSRVSITSLRIGRSFRRIFGGLGVENSTLLTFVRLFTFISFYIRENKCASNVLTYYAWMKSRDFGIII